MVSPAKTRTSGFSNLHDAPYDSGASTRLQKPLVATKYDAVSKDGDDAKRLRRLVDHVKQSLEPFNRSGGGGSGIHASVPAADTIRRFLDKASRSGADAASTVDADSFRKCLYALGVNPEDTAFLLERFDRKHTGTIDRQAFVSTFLPAKTTTAGLQRHRFGGYNGSDDGNNNSSTLADERRRRDQDASASGNTHAIDAFHQKVIERVLLRYANVKEAFRQYDSNRLGVLSTTQFRVFLRDLGFVGRDVEALMRHLDRSNQQQISFNAFAHPGGKQLASDHTYVKSPQKRKLMQPLDRKQRRQNAEEDDQYGGDPMEKIRAKLRQRVIGRSKSIREIFMEFDADGNGHLDHEEFKLFMAAYDFSPDETRAAIAFLDKDFSGTIDYDEYASGLLFYRPSPTAKAGSTRASAMTEEERQAKHGAYLLEVVKEKLSGVLLARKKSIKVGHLRDEFDKFDTDGSGALDYQEFGAFLMGLGVKLSPRDLEALMVVVDGDGSNQIEFDEFESVFDPRGSPIARKIPSPERNAGPHLRLSGDESLEAAFSKYDTDNSGLLDYNEFSQLLRDQGFRESDITQATKQIDQHGDGGINVETFKSIVQSREWKLSNFPPATMAKASRSPLKQLNHQPKKVPVPVENMLVTRILRDHQSLEEAFRQHDLDGSGELDHDEFRRFMKHYGMREDHDINQLIAKLDVDGSGAVSLDEFMAHFQLKPTHTLPKARTKEDQRLVALRELTQVWVEGVMEHHASLEHAFRDHDRQQRNELDYEQFRDLMTQYGISDDGNIRLLLSTLDTDQSGSVSLDEFQAFFQPFAASVQKLRKADRRKSQIKPSATSGFAAEQAKARATRLRLLEEQWIKQALDSHGSVRKAFEQFDADQSGALDHDEFRQLMTTFGITRDEDIAMMIKRLDLDGSGSIDYDEFVTVFHERRVKNQAGKTASGSRKASTSTFVAETKSSSAARLRELELKWIKRALSCHSTIEAAFGEYDRDGNGTLEHEEFAHCMKRYGIAREEDISRLIKRLDLDGSGTIDYNEFSTVFNALRCESYGTMAALGGVGAGGDDQELDAEELASVMEIERELADRILKNTRDMRLAFRKFDINGNGRLEYSEFRTVLKSYKFPEPEIRKVIRHLDRDVSGFIDYREFIAGFAAVADSNSSSNTNGGARKAGARTSLKPALKKQGTISRLAGSTANADSVDALKKKLLERILSSYGTVQSTFRKYDTARNGSLEPKQFEKMAVDLGFSRDQARVLLDHFDADRSGTVEYEEFLSRLIAESEPH